MVDFSDLQSKCLFIKGEGENQKIALENLFPWEIVEALKGFNNNSLEVLTNCNKDTILFPGIPENYHAIKWDKIQNIESIFQDNQTTISVILRSKDGVIYYIANMNLEAYNNSVRDGKLWVYSKTNKQLQLKGSTSGDIINLDPLSFVQGNNSEGQTILMVNVYPTKPSVCHEKNPDTGVGYPTCFFRPVQEFLDKVNNALKTKTDK